MSADELHTEFCDFDINENTEIDSEIIYRYNDYEDSEIDLEEYNLKEIDSSMVGEVVMDRNFIPKLQFVDEDSIPFVRQEENKNTLTEKKSFICDTCGKKYVKKAFFVKHISKCGNEGKVVEEHQQHSNADGSEHHDKTGEIFCIFHINSIFRVGTGIYFCHRP